MKKKISFFSLLLLVGFSVNAEIAAARFSLVEKPNDFGVTISPTKKMKEVKVQDNPDVDVAKAYKIKEKEYEGEVRFSYFQDNGGNLEKLETDFFVYLQMCLYNLLGTGTRTTGVNRLNPSDVKSEFNGDFGVQVTAIDPTSEYAKGYKFMYVDCYCKQDIGIVLRAYLFNDLEFMGINSADGSPLSESILFNNFHLFKFNNE